MGEVVQARHAGREFDPETGLYYNRARYYAPSSGRFLSEDPLGFAAGDTNLYRYVGNSPLERTDPTGLWWEDLVIGVPSIGLGIWSLSNDVQQGEVGWAIVDSVGIAADVVALVLPGIPGAAGLGIKAYRAGDLTADAVRATRRGQAALGVYHACTF